MTDLALRSRDTPHDIFVEEVLPYWNQALVAGAAAWFETADDCQRAMMGFVSHRLEKDNKTFRNFADCRSLSELATLNSNWLHDILQDYEDEYIDLVEICRSHSL